MQLLLDPEVRQISMGALHQLHIDVKECEGESCSFDMLVSYYAVKSDSTNTDAKKHNCIKKNFKPQSYMSQKPVSQAHC